MSARDYKLDYKGYVIHLTGETSEEDFHLINGMPVISGYGVAHGKGHEYAGCNPVPGAMWFTTLEDAKFAVDVFKLVEGEQKEAELFHQSFDLYKNLREQARATILKHLAKKVGS